VKYPDAVFSAGSVISMTDKGKVLLSQLSLWPRDGYYTPPEGLFNMMGRVTVVVRVFAPLETLGLLAQFLVLGATWALATTAVVCLAPKTSRALVQFLGSHGRAIHA
jgi:hypothetical protein